MQPRSCCTTPVPTQIRDAYVPSRAARTEISLTSSEGGRAGRRTQFPNQQRDRSLEALTGNPTTYSAMLSAAGRANVLGYEGEAFAGLDSTAGDPLRHIHANWNFKGSPMTCLVAVRRFIAMESGIRFWAFALSAESLASNTP